MQQSDSLKHEVEKENHAVATAAAMYSLDAGVFSAAFVTMNAKLVGSVRHDVAQLPRFCRIIMNEKFPLSFVVDESCHRVVSCCRCSLNEGRMRPERQAAHRWPSFPRTQRRRGTGRKVLALLCTDCLMPKLHRCTDFYLGYIVCASFRFT